MSPQRRSSSFIEAVANTLIGYGIALAGQLIVFPTMGIQVTFGQNLIIGAIFMGISTARSYLLRRMFEALRVNGVLA